MPDPYAPLIPLYKEWNEKINVVSRKDIDNLRLHHIQHSLALLHANPFPDGARVLDLGTGGGFPGIPLAIARPGVQFTLIDSIGKKIRVAEAVRQVMHLDNVRTLHQNVVEHRAKPYDIIVSRAVARLDEIWRLTQRLLAPSGVLLTLKGGDNLAEECQIPGTRSRIIPISDFFPEDFFIGKFIVETRRAPHSGV